MMRYSKSLCHSSRHAKSGPIRTIAILLGVVICTWSVMAGQNKETEKDKNKDKKPVIAAVVVTVAGDGTAVQNANVLLTTSDDSYNESLYTDKHGRAQFSGVPVGNVTLQVIASGWKTHGSTEIVKAPSSHFDIALAHKPVPSTDSISNSP
jgi:hypothetical protein